MHDREARERRKSSTSQPTTGEVGTQADREGGDAGEERQGKRDHGLTGLVTDKSECEYQDMNDFV